MIEVAAAIVVQDGKYLICRRGAGGSCAWLWEFPGGKREPGESLEDCVVRECREELAIGIRLLGVFAGTVYRYPERAIALTFFLAEPAGGDLKPAVHEETRWAAPGELRDFTFCPADTEIAERLAQSRIVPHRKLVRDAIPGIVEAAGCRALWETLPDGEYLPALESKLGEEMREYLGSGDVEELADMLEVIRAIAAAKGVPAGVLEDIRREKAGKRGGFDRRIFLKDVIEFDLKGK